MWLKIIIVFLVLVAVGGGIAFYFTNTITTVGDKFMGAIFNKDTETAYSLLTPTVQGEVSYDDFKKAINSAYAHNVPGTKVTWNTRVVENSSGTLSGVYKIDDGKDVKIDIELEKEGGIWHISYFLSK